MSSGNWLNVISSGNTTWNFFKEYHGLSENSLEEFLNNKMDDIILSHGQTGARGPKDVLRDRESGKVKYTGPFQAMAGVLSSKRTWNEWAELARIEAA